MTQQERAVLRKATIAVRLRDAGTSPSAVSSDRWMLQTSNSFRRIGTQRGDGDVLCGTKHPHDGQPDLLAAPGVLDYIVAAQPYVVTSLLDDLDVAHAIVEKIGEIETRLDKVRVVLCAAVEKLSTAEGVSIAEVRDVLATIHAALAEVQQ